VELAVQETPAVAPASPRAEYAARRAARLAQEAEHARLENLLGNGRLLSFLLGVVLAGFALAGKVPAAAAVVPFGVFAFLLVWHERVVRRLRRAGRAAAFYEKGLARLDHRWSGTGQPGTRFLDEKHPNAPDLDLFGTGSVFELLCTARTRKGEDTLAGWLLAPAAPEDVRERQVAVEDLRQRLDLREDLALLGADVPEGVDLEGLAAWGAAPPVLVSPVARLAALVLASLSALALVAWLFSDVGAGPLAILMPIEMAFAAWLRSRVLRVLKPIDRRAHDLMVFAGLLARLEAEDFTALLLLRHRQELNTAGLPPSRRIGQLARLIDLHDQRRNTLFAPLAPLLLWSTQMAFALEAWRATSGPAIARWLAAVGELEALCALAAYAYENPADPFPEIVSEGPCFEGVGLGHPLIPEDRCVRNDVALGGDLRVLVVSGSNMSGKSTLLRTVGVNAVLALAGAPVRAERLRLSPVVVGATLRIQDSLQAGKSRFYAEITRVRQLVELAGGPCREKGPEKGSDPLGRGSDPFSGPFSPPLLFLLDEIFHGTNSHDRRQGAEAIVRGLVRRGAIGLVTTHDLALAAIAERMAPEARNVHFEDHLESGTIVFDYRMRPGVVQHSNALALMRAVGLDV
jgi:hypothetical protein